MHLETAYLPLIQLENSNRDGVMVVPARVPAAV